MTGGRTCSREVRFTGLVKQCQGKPQIILDSRDQLAWSLPSELPKRLPPPSRWLRVSEAHPVARLKPDGLARDQAALEELFPPLCIGN